MTAIIPLPREMTELPGSFNFIPAHIRINTNPLDLTVFSCLIPQVKWSLDQSLSKFSFLAQDAPTGSISQKMPESYFLRISQKGIFANASDAAGLYYAVQTLSQIMRDSGTDHLNLPCCEIKDFPRFPLRIYHDDISRGQVSTIEDFRRILRTLGRYKINAYIPYIEDMLYLKGFPDIGEGRGCLTHEELKEMHLEAHRHHVRIIPAFCLLGHCENLLAMPAYSHLARQVPQLPSSFNVNHPELHPFLEKVIAELASLFEDDIVHGGFDECRGLTCEEFCSHAEWVASELGKYGKKLVIYYDMFINHFGREAAEKLSENIIFANWNYSDLSDFPGEKELSDSKHKHWVLTGLNNCCQLTFSLEKASRNIRNFLRQGAECGASAAVLTGWGDNGYENQRDINWNLIAFFAEMAWSGENVDLRTFLLRFHNDFYGATLPELADMLLSMSDPEFAGIHGWTLWHATPCAMERLTENNPALVKVCRIMEPLITEYEKILMASEQKATREKSHFDHYKLCLWRMKNVVERVLAGEQFSEFRKKNDRDAIKNLSLKLKSELLSLGHFYKNLWLRHNKPENLEWSYAWYERLGHCYDKLPGDETALGQIVDLSTHFNESPMEICGIPKRNTVYNSTSFHFQEHGNFSVKIAQNEKVKIMLKKNTEVRDLHLLLAGSYVTHQEEPVLKISLHHGTEIVFEELLLGRKHVPDWYAPRGDMWAGSGCLFLDPERVKLIWDGVGLSGRAQLFGLFEVSNFKIARNLLADSMSLENISRETIIHIVAITIT